MAKNVSNIKTALVYANAMYEGSEKINESEVLYADAQKLQDALKDDSQLLKKMDSPLWNVKAKLEIIEAIADKLSLCSSLTNTLKILAENRKIVLLDLILEQYVRIYQQKHDIAEIEVTTVIELNAKQQQLLKEKLHSIFNKEILLKYVINPDIIGGLVLKYGTDLIDNSIKHKLRALEQIMKGNK